MKPSRVVLLVILILAIAGVAYNYYPPFRFLTWLAAGRSPVCTLQAALKSDENLQKQVEYKDQILNASKMLQEDPQGFEQWETPNGTYWIPAGSRYVLPFNLAEQKRKIYGVGDYGPHAGDITLDCGANVGVTVHEELAAGAKIVVAIEPAPENLECLRRNYPSQIQAGRVIVVPKGVWDKEDFLTLRVDPKNSAADSFVIKREGAVDVERVPLTTIDKLVTDLKLPRVDYIKLDIEGAEPNALRGARETLAKYKPRISIASYHEPDHPRVIPEIIRSVRSDYQMACGPCVEAERSIRPDVLYFK
ncbi:MAG TPA: FkbM family methyltransferase [Bryobacteraceae bacterium]|nr:FkbM family methyltransferase [Bryobacteraceae bacterium]